MLKVIFASLFIFFLSYSYGQNYMDTVFTIETEIDISYGTSIDFAGNERDLLLDISYPTDDTIPECGRPLMVVIHGGSFIAGSKSEGYIPSIRKDFAKRGYTTAAINYRLGQFQPSAEINCNTSAFGLDWNCLNMADTTEWHRAYHRGIQDANGALRFLINNAEEYNIDPQNIFVVGESAGGYIAMGVGFIDNEEETFTFSNGEHPDVLPPNSIYESQCIQGYGFDTSIVSMNLSRPDLGSYEGEINIPLETEYKIRGVGNFYGGVFKNIFHTTDNDPPALYMFHQPNDLIVPYNYNKILAGFSLCASGFPFNCQAIVNRPFTYGSNAINGLLLEMELDGELIPDYLFDNSSNTADCALQVLDPTLSGHSIDNYWLRTNTMAGFFAPKIEECNPIGIVDFYRNKNRFSIYPNPLGSDNSLRIKGDFKKQTFVSITDAIGKVVYSKECESGRELSINLSSLNLEPSTYIVQIIQEGKQENLRFVLTQ